MHPQATMKTRLFLCLLTALVAVPLGACKTNPVTGRTQFNALSREQEIAIGNEAMPDLIEGYGGRIGNLVIERYVSGVGDSLAAQTELDYPSMPWEFTVLDSDVINAFALPGGKVFITRGLLKEMDNEAQLAGVLGHEIGHVTGQHADDKIGRQYVLAGIATAGAIVAGTSDDRWVQVGAGVVVGASGVFALTFDRNQELEADRLGMRYMRRAKYAPAALEGVMEILAEASKGGQPPEFLSTHPHPETRIEAIRERLGEPPYSRTVNNPEYIYNADRFRQKVLSELALMAPASHRAPFDLAYAGGWCAHCAR